MPGKGIGRRVSGRDRRTDTRQTRPRLLIVCEGTETEPNYFKALLAFHKIVSVEVRIMGTGRNTLSLVEFAANQQGRGADRYAEIWCVFDCDSFPAENFDNTIAKCAGAGGKPHSFLRSAWSNESFELWYLLHLQDLKTSPVRGGHGRAREYYNDRLDDLLKQLGVPEYSKNAPDMYELLGNGRRDLAAKRADALLQSCDAATPFHENKPATTVHILVNRLLQYAPENEP